jgi:hypothetical protein
LRPPDPWIWRAAMLTVGALGYAAATVIAMLAQG